MAKKTLKPARAEKAAPSALVRELVLEANENPYERIWAGFLTTRVVVGLLLLLALGWQWFAQPGAQHWGQGSALEWRLGIAAAYLLAALAARLWLRQTPLLRQFSLTWMTVIGVDLLAFAALLALREEGGNLAPLMLLPVLEAAVLGSMLLAMGTAALVTIVMLLGAWLLNSVGLREGDWLQVAAFGAGLFVLAFVANQLASRLQREGVTSQKIRSLADVQSQVNQLIIDALPSGLLIADETGQILHSNPSARRLLGLAQVQHLSQLPVQGQEKNVWRWAQQTLQDGQARQVELALELGESLAHTAFKFQRVSAFDGEAAAPGFMWCVVFVQDLREEQARAREEKLLSMGRMSAAVAHEIRNPLAAISQANELLAEELQDPVQKRLSKMIRENAVRLGRIVDEVLDVARVQEQGQAESQVLALGPLLQRMANEWREQNAVGERLQLDLNVDLPLNAWFDADHLRRIVVNLLDNALRYASDTPGAIRLRLLALDEGWQELSVWSDGPPLEESLQKHLFEPFFSSESRSSGLGLYICRQLSERHGGKIMYRQGQREGRKGNEFVLYMRANSTLPAAAGFVSTVI